MVRKTIAINDELFQTLKVSHVMDEYSSFSELVSNALKLLIENQKKEQYKKAMLEASKDPLYLQDMKEITDDFSYADFENIQ